MYSAIKLFGISALLCALSFRSNAQQSDSLKSKQPVWTAELSYNLPEFYNHGFGLHAGYYPVRNSWLRFGPGIQANYFFTPYKQWFISNNKEKSLISELHLNLLANLEFVPFRKNSFFIGIAPYIGYEWINNKGRVSNELNGFDLKYNYNVHLFDWGTRFKLGGYIGKKQKYGLAGHFQMSNRGIADDDPRTGFVNIGLSDYKAFVGLTFIYRIK